MYWYSDFTHLYFVSFRADNSIHIVAPGWVAMFNDYDC
jgi:hypothetical protein